MLHQKAHGTPASSPVSYTHLDVYKRQLQVIVAKSDILLRPAAVYIRRRKAPVIVPNTSSACHSRNGCFYKITPVSYTHLVRK